MDLPLFLKTVFVISPWDTGSTPWAESICRQLGCTHVVKDWHPQRPRSPGALHLTSSSRQALNAAGHNQSNAVLVQLAVPPSVTSSQPSLL